MRLPAPRLPLLLLSLAAAPAVAAPARVSTPKALASPAAPAILSAAAARYRVDPSLKNVADLGEGDFGEVRSGVMPKRPPQALSVLAIGPGQPIAVKIPYEDPGGMMAHEAQVSRRLAQAGGAELFVRAAHDPELGVLVMEKLEGYRPLDEWAEARGRIDARTVRRVGDQLRRALEVLRAAGLVHSDLKPDNVLVDPKGRVKIVDLGLAAEKGRYPPYREFEGRRGGNHNYVSPNQLRNGPAAFEDDHHSVTTLLRQLGPPPALPELVKDFLKAEFLAPAKYAKSFLRSLSEPKPGAPILRPRDGRALSAALEELGLRLGLRARLLGPLASAKQQGAHAAFLAVFESGGRPAGIFGYVVKQGKDGARVGEIHSVYFDKKRLPDGGLAQALLGFSADALAPAMGVTRETLKADYLGRYVWAQAGFQFDRDYRYYDLDGKTYKSWEIARRSLARFLRRHKVKLGELRLRGEALGSLEALETPEDFAALEEQRGRAFLVRPLLTQDSVGEPVGLPLGKAFMTASYLPGKPPYVLSQGGPRFGTKFAPDAMPFWNGYRELNRSRSR